MKRRPPITPQAAEQLAIQTLTFIAGDPAALGRFLALTGIGPAEIRGAARESGFLVGVLDYLLGDEVLLVGFAADAGVAPEDVAQARATLSGENRERDVP
jgi:hypothetical protein